MSIGCFIKGGGFDERKERAGLTCCLFKYMFPFFKFFGFLVLLTPGNLVFASPPPTEHATAPLFRAYPGRTRDELRRLALVQLRAFFSRRGRGTPFYI